MVSFLTNCYGGWRVIALLLCNRNVLSKYIISCNYIKVELEIKRCLCMYVSSTFLKHCYDLRRHF